MAIREAEPVASLNEVREAGLDREDLLQIYRNMVITRGIEERGHILYRQGKIPGSFYTGRGNEAASVGVAMAMGAEDVGTPLHRDMGVHITRGVEPWRIFAQYMGRRDGPTKGKDGNVHMADARLGMIAMVSHLPAMLPVASGCALAFRIREERRVAVGWFGEGASARGDAHESMTFAGTRTSPTARPRTASTASSSTAPTSSRSTARRSARSRRRAKAAGRRSSSVRHCGWRATPSPTTRSTCRRSSSRSGRSATRSSASACGSRSTRT
jgi:Dehydrogenase E1 component